MINIQNIKKDKSFDFKTGNPKQETTLELFEV